MALEQLAVFDSQLAAFGPFLLGQQFSACDIYLQMTTTWHETPQDPLTAMPDIKAVCGRVTQRSACRWAFKQHDFAAGHET